MKLHRPLLFALLVALTVATFVLAVQQSDIRKVEAQATNDKARKRVAAIGVRFRWHGMGGGHGCNAPLGLCITIPFAIADSPARQLKGEDDSGIAFSRVVGNRLHMVFSREAALEDGTIRLNRDKVLEREVAQALGYTRIVMKAGTYRVDKKAAQYGMASVRIVKGAAEPIGTATVTCYLYENTTGHGKGCGVACDDGTSYQMNCKADIFK